MRIKKVKQSTAVVAQAVNEHATGNDKVYDVDYINTMQDNIEDGINEIPMKILESSYDIDTIKQSGNYGIFNATGTLPTGFSTSDNNIIIECFKWSNSWCRQVLYDVRTTGGIYTRILSNGTWLGWVKISTQ